GWGGIRTRGTFRYTRFPGVPNRPLWDPSSKQTGSLERLRSPFNPNCASRHPRTRPRRRPRVFVIGDTEWGGIVRHVLGSGRAEARTLPANALVTPEIPA